MLFDALLFSFSSVDGYDPRFYYENVSPHANPSSLFHSYLITTKCVLCFSEEDKLAALIREPEMRMCYEQRFQQTFADAQPLFAAGCIAGGSIPNGGSFLSGQKGQGSIYRFRRLSVPCALLHPWALVFGQAG